MGTHIRSNDGEGGLRADVCADEYEIRPDDDASTSVGSGPVGTELLGREHETGLVGALLEELPRGGRVLRVRAAAGMGRSAFVRFAAAAAERRGIRVRSAVWTPAERTLPYASLHALLALDLSRLHVLPAVHRTALDTAFGGGPAQAAPTEAQETPLVAAVTAVAAATLHLLATAPQPVLLCVDDLDRLDPASRDVLNELSVRLDRGTPAAVGMIVTERAAEGVPTPATTHGPGHRTVTLEALPAPAARALLTRTGRPTEPRTGSATEPRTASAGSPRAIGFGYTEEQLVLAVSAGNPLALTELSLGGDRLGDEAGFGMLPATPRLAGAYAEDLNCLSASARCVLLVAALSVSPSAHDVVAASALLLGDDTAASAGLAEATARGLLTEVGTRDGATKDTGGTLGGMPGGMPGTSAVLDVSAVLDASAIPDTSAVPDTSGASGASDESAVPDIDVAFQLGFPQPLLRPAVLRLESAALRLAAHAALGQSLRDPAHAAWHTARCSTGPDEAVARLLESRADGPQSGTRVLTALVALEDAARFSPDPECRAGRLLRATELACDHGLVEQALRLARQIDPTELGSFGKALLLWVHELLPGNSVVGRERIADLCGAARAVAAKDPALTQKLLHAAARRCWWQQASPAERRTVRRAFEELRSGGAPDASDLAVMALTDPLSVSRQPEPRVPPRLAAVPPDGDASALLGQVAHLTTDLERAAPLLETAEAAVRADGRYGRLPQILVPRAMGRIWLGTELRTARALAEEGRTVAERTGQPDWVARATAVLGIAEALHGHHERALECAAEVEEASLRLGQKRQLGLAALARALVASGTGRYVEAYARLRSLFTEPTELYAYEEFLGLAFLAEAAVPAGETADARTVVEHVASLTKRGRAPLLERILAYADAVLAPDEEAESRYHRALERGLEDWPLLHGMTQFGHGAWLRRRRRVTASRTPLATAESCFRALGAHPRAEQAAAELRATGQAAPVEQPAGDAGSTERDDLAQVLSPQQLTIALLAARGLTNRAIGEQLRLSPRTVASHLYQIFPKLDVTSRAQLAARLGGG